MRLQTGGELGLVTLGVGYAAWDSVALDLYYGWVPAAVGGRDVHSIALRLDGRVTGICLGPNLSWRYVNAGVGAVMGLGDRFFLTTPRGYDPDYTQTAVHALFTLGTALEWRLEDTSVLATMGSFVEVTTIDVYAAAWLKNTRTLGFLDIWSMSLGFQAGF